MDFEKYFLGYEDILRAELDLARVTFKHSGNRGDALESVFRAFLDRHTARELEVGHGEVIDSHGQHAGSTEHDGQIDCILIDPRHPRFSDVKLPSTYVIEGVLLAGEIKTTLTTQGLKASLEKAREFKKLKARSTAGDMIMSNDQDTRRFYDRRPFFLFCFESQLTISNIFDTVVEDSKTLNTSLDQIIDAIFCLDRGVLVNFGDGSGQLKMRKDGKPIQGWGEAGNKTLFELIRWSSAVYPKFSRMGNFMMSYF